MLPKLHINGSLAEIQLGDPLAGNKLTADDLPILSAHIRTVNASPEVLVLTLKSEGKHFCSGFDISQVASKSQIKGESFGEMIDQLENCRAITIARVQGGVYGGATDMALACDFRLGGQAANMFMPAAKLGLHFYLSGLERYVSRLGLDTAKRLFLTGEKLDAPSMRACGFLTHLVDDEALDEEVAKLVSTLIALAPIPLLGMKKHLNRIAQGRANAHEVAVDVQRSIVSADLAEGGLAWKEKRIPMFTGR